MEPREYKQSKSKTPKPANMLVGFIILTVGVVLLVDRLDYVLVPRWLFTWPMLLIVLGFLIGAKKNFHGAGWLILMMIGTFFLLDNYFFFHWDLHRYGLPLGIIILGLFLLFRSISSSHRHDSGYYTTYKVDHSEPEENTPDEKKKMSAESDDFIDQTNVFGSSKSRVFSKRFRGGDSTNFFGGAEIDLTHADIDGKAVLDVVQVFGGLKLIVPANWTVKTDAVTILGGLTDKRPSSASDAGKVLVITGTCIFGGIEIKSY